MQRHYIYHIHKFIEIDDITHTIANKQEISSELERLENINHLGLISRVFPLTRHTKFEHCVGLYHLCSLAGDNVSGLNKLKIHKQSLKLAGLLHAIGHFPLTYTSEKALAYLHSLDNRTLTELDKIADQIGKELGWNEKDTQKYKRSSVGQGFAKLYRLLTAYKILNFADFPPEYRNQTIRYLVEQQNPGYQLLDLLDFVEFTLRDAFYLNEIVIELNLLPFLKGISFENSYPKPPDVFDAIASLNSYLKENVYRNAQVIGVSELYTRTLILLFKQNALNLGQMLVFSDSDLLREIENKRSTYLGDTLKIEGLLKALRDGRISRVFKCFIQSDDDLFSADKKIVRVRASNFVKNPLTQGYYLALERERIRVMPRRSITGWEVSIFCDLKKHSIVDVLSMVTMCENQDLFCEVEPTNQILSFLFGLKVQPNYERYTKARRYVQKAVGATARKKSDIGKLFHGDNERIDSVLNYIERVSLDDALEFLVDDFLGNPQLYSEKLVGQVAAAVRKARPRESVSKEILQEYGCFLQCVISAQSSECGFWVAPGVNIYNKDGTQRAEIDVISLEYLGRAKKPHLKFIEVSVDDSTNKELEIRNKLEQSKRIVEQRFPRCLKIECFFNGKEIC